MKPVRVIVFDAVGTLIHTRPSVAAIYHTTGQQFGSQLDQPTIAARFSALFAEIFEKKKTPPPRPALGGISQEAQKIITPPRPVFGERGSGVSASRRAGGEGPSAQTNPGGFSDSCLSPEPPFSDPSQRHLWQTLVARLFTELADTAPLFNTLWDRFADPTTWAVYPDVPPALTALHAAGYRLAIGSNFDSRLHPIVAGLPELQPIERVWTPIETGWPKPDRHFFDAIATSLVIAPQECLMVGDSLCDDVTGAIAAGWQAIHLDRPSTLSTHADFLAVHSLNQLVSHLSSISRQN